MLMLRPYKTLFKSSYLNVGRRDASALMSINADWRQRTFHQQPTAIPQ
jgi:hypothetical protein